jgi:hypothetical protein
MDPFSIAGSAVGSLGSLYGSYLQSKSADKANAQQMDLAKNSIKYRTQDAINSGIHPLYALGAPTLTTSHVTSSMGQGVAQAAGSLGNAISNMGQAKAKNLQLENAKLQNDLIKYTIAGKIQEQYQSGLRFEQEQKLKEAGRNKLAPLNIKLPPTKKKLPPTKSSSKKDLKIAGFKVTKNKDWSDAEDIEARYADPAAWFYGLGVIGADAYSSVKSWWNSLSKKDLKDLEDYWNRIHYK